MVICIHGYDMGRETTGISGVRDSDRIISHIIQTALDEDIGSGDITGLSILPEDHVARGTIVAREEGILAGLEVAQRTFLTSDSRIDFNRTCSDGDTISRGTIIAKIEGPGRPVIGAERVALNFLQRMSGIATLTRSFVERVSGTRVKILDTRKTAPGLRLLDKWAVRLGGGFNHRAGLYDMILIKENHIAIAGGIGEAITRARSYRRDVKIEVEVRNLNELGEALEYKPDRILLDNMNTETLREAVKRTAGSVSLEASGNITLDTVAAVAETGVDFISIGALTHSVRALDISLLIDIHQPKGT
jgi:nicotinate-nucleotide pyrophosphorylase (carboxylating)